MTEQIYTTRQIKAMLQPVFMNYNIKKAILFGSYADGAAKPNSDVDILVDSRLRGLAFFGLLEDVASTLDKDVDMIDVSQITENSEVDKEIKKNGVLIYG